MPRTKSSQRWLARNAKDKYVKRARQDSARSRATYKLEEIDRRDHLLRPGMTVVDLGAAPGGWSQYVKSRVGDTGRVLALDILPMEPIVGVEFIEGDFTEQPVLDLLMQRLQGKPVDLVISDMAPNMSGVASVDQARSMNLAELALDFSDKSLKPGGSLLIKTFQGAGFNEFYAQLRRRFEKLVTRKPSASRAESKEIYLVGRGFR
ncbi:MAG: 23S rRNA methyltransferase [Candidatus Muproteobacteria bacterium RIFCSPHIGHO2_12_FULL_60_33]|uniref:Ribosomal RNA large subunit methyltransferase E n=1 Tax=Candidatus Muproteobacteria bacterium RIFCSPLOWO2_01_FULL_60_18 TaxID=1817768 RepID=A0A1F6TXK3_9PROT|nr:MAG: 23S rRNA methyltransferase [Candidatus Muproteobacteria bacterium RIFCSPHIGHO2_01_60_12]OGI49821.1 MAG: 23S rRNA methyltransferase [Candidatus Muproteobacteria bacterium RIFCSPLOWO2_01_FULL_60_18]OGI53818.1 MAG: 23S rRNA methyltransferase [Candidatus Muproteobacteria bacterium RIFCSPHIGHO2_02_FULL_60_13]OGI54756.1 MAG: 23S rRNA methyltransferase [Candidatus Muproteobacteria bacterium RIFCSPHIGHO2_12_FULL_60_33]OGI60218.1 MAG: 23S rRNA methyltransferase [Candidatus Muproteobacteria bacte